MPSETPSRLREALALTAAEVSRVLAEVTDTTDLAHTIALVESAGRLMDAARVHAAAPVTVAESERLGFASPVAAVASLAQVSERTARARLALAAAVTPEVSLTGARLPATHPVVATALDTGQLGVDAAVLLVRELDTIAGRVDTDALDAAEQLMVNLATGIDASGGRVAATVSVDYLTSEIRQVAATIDPDGARPREERAQRRRAFRLGTPDDDGLVAPQGRLTPEVAAVLTGLLEAHRRSPRFRDRDTDTLDTDTLGVDTLAGADDRTPDQRRHDAFAEIIATAATTDGAPNLDGLPVTVLVTVRHDDLTNPDGLDSDPIGTMTGSDTPVSRATVERFIDNNGYRTATLTHTGAMVSLSSTQRCFTPQQRLAIAARDGHHCLTPGCTNPHTTLQAHHVTPARTGGPTIVSNGILLCYWHHTIVDTGPWAYRIEDGVPQVRGPGIHNWTPARPTHPHAA